MIELLSKHILSLEYESGDTRLQHNSTCGPGELRSFALTIIALG